MASANIIEKQNRINAPPGMRRNWLTLLGKYDPGESLIKFALDVVQPRLSQFSLSPVSVATGSQPPEPFDISKHNVQTHTEHRMRSVQLLQQFIASLTSPESCSFPSPPRDTSSVQYARKTPGKVETWSWRSTFVSCFESWRSDTDQRNSPALA